jgi:hypothetical protein
MPDAVFPSRRDEAAAPAGSAHFLSPELLRSHNDEGRPAEEAPLVRLRSRSWSVGDQRDPAGYSVISWIFLVSSGSGGPLCSAMALVMSPCSLILPAMNACMAACGLASTIIALAVS